MVSVQQLVHGPIDLNARDRTGTATFFAHCCLAQSYLQSICCPEHRHMVTLPYLPCASLSNAETPSVDRFALMTDETYRSFWKQS